MGEEIIILLTRIFKEMAKLKLNLIFSLVLKAILLTRVVLELAQLCNLH